MTVMAFLKVKRFQFFPIPDQGNYGVVFFLEQLADQVAADESRASGYQYFHGAILYNPL